MNAVEGPLQSAARPRFKVAVKLRDAGVAVGGMVLGALVGTGVQQTLARTGVLGPGVSSVLAQQQANFAEVNTKLDDLRQLSSDPEQQGTLAAQTEQQLELMAAELAAGKDRQLAERGVAGGADFWLKGGESFNLGARDQVFALQAYGRGIAAVNLSGVPARMAVGDVIDFMAAERACKVFFKQATPREDGRVGFDLDCG